MRDTDERIVTPEVELKELDKIASSRLKNSSSCDKDVQMRAVNTIAIDIQSTRSSYGNFCVWTTLTKKKQFMWTESLINIAICLLNEPLDYTDVTAHKIVTTDDRLINTKQYRFLPFHKEEINKI